MLSKVVVLFLIGMLALSVWGKFRARRMTRYCPHCGRPNPCGCPKGQA